MNCPSRTDDTDGREGWNQSPNLLAGTTREDFNGRTNATARRSLDPDALGDDVAIARLDLDLPPPLAEKKGGEKVSVVADAVEGEGHVIYDDGRGGVGGGGGGGGGSGDGGAGRRRR